MTKLGAKDVHSVRTRGGNRKFRAMRLETGNFSWGSEVCTRKTRILDVVYNAVSNELVRTKTLVKNAIVMVDATPFRQWYEQHYAVSIGKGTKIKGKKDAEAEKEAKREKSELTKKKYAARQQGRVLDNALDDQFAQGRLLAAISSRPGQSGRADGYILEGKELDFYKRKLDTRKQKK